MKIQRLKEKGAGPARVSQHISDGRPFAMISADRGERGTRQNRQARNRLRDLLTKNKLSFSRTRGGFHEVDRNTGEKKAVDEESFLVYPNPNQEIDQFFVLMTALSYRFEQEGIMFGDGSEIWFVDTSGPKPQKYKAGEGVTFDPDRVENQPGYSDIKGRRFSAVPRGE